MKLKLGIFTSFCSMCLLAGGLSFDVGSASAVPMWSDIAGKPGTHYHDTDLDYFTNVNGSASTIDVGDVLTAVLSYSNAYQLHNYLPTGTSAALSLNQLNAVTTIEVTAINRDGSGNVLSIAFGQNGITPMVQYYTGGTLGDPILASHLNLTTAVSRVESGTYLWGFSLVDPTNNYWIFQPNAGFLGSTVTISDVADALPSTTVGTITLALDQVYGTQLFGPIANGHGGFADLTGTGSIYGGGGSLPYAFANSTSEAYVNPVPEPVTMTLFGLGLMGLGVFGKRRNRS